MLVTDNLLLHKSGDLFCYKSFSLGLPPSSFELLTLYNKKKLSTYVQIDTIQVAGLFYAYYSWSQGRPGNEISFF